MEIKKGYYLEKMKTSKQGIEDQLNEWYDSGFDWVGSHDNYFVFRKRDKK